ncbi:hypothetical protein B4U80_12841 [Leptotrombidium deliense]|uniref:MOSC domain-containing protein n=1 Tax=Leptotrombidium deliense TaxID=299467 RepID=A0A443SJV9_9ACAR|nr:hypothetical protein B4U80_12841 [Leptotrombidium deliense]
MTLKNASYALFTSLVFISAYLIWKRRKSYTNVGRVKKLIIYPVKSLPGIEVSSLEITKVGAKYLHWFDRGIAIVNSNNVIVTQRMKPLLALLKQSFVGDEIWIEAPNQETLKIKYVNELNIDSNVITATHFAYKSVKGMDCGDDYAAWIQKYLQGEGYRMMRHVKELPLRSSAEWNGVKVDFNKEEQIVFQDKNPVHVVNDSSVAELNSKISEEEITYRRFRPNILIDCQAYSEDCFREIRINETLLRRQIKVERCVLTTVDPNEGTMSNIKEPLKTLKQTRMPPKSSSKVEAAYYTKNPLFGVSCCVSKPGIITVNDQISVKYF